MARTATHFFPALGMSHSEKEKQKLVARIKRIRGLGADKSSVPSQELAEDLIDLVKPTSNEGRRAALAVQPFPPFVV
jgi:hypothetical protein